VSPLADGDGGLLENISGCFLRQLTQIPGYKPCSEAIDHGSRLELAYAPACTAPQAAKSEHQKSMRWDLLMLLARIVGGIEILEAKWSNSVTCVTYSPDFAQWKWHVSPGSTITLPGG
jgi:hypothetical protein